MPWWNRKRSASSSPSSFSSSSRSSSAGDRSGRSRDIFSWKRRSAPRRKLPNIEVGALSPSFDLSAGSTPVSWSPGNLDQHPARLSSSSLVGLPQPLPLPESIDKAASLNRESSLVTALGLPSPNSVCCPLPSPKDPSGNSEGEDANRSTAESDPIGKRISSVGAAGRHNRKMFRDPNSVGASNFRLNIPAKSAPASGMSSPCSPLSSPRRSSYVDFSSFALATQGWSASEVASADAVTVLSLRASAEKIASSDISPLHSPPIKSPAIRSRNPSASSSPLHAKLFPDTSATWHDSGASFSVHRLPLPPGASSPSNSGFSHQNMSKSEPPSMTYQWQKGKLIGSGTFGNVYEATNRETGALCAMKEVNIIPDDARSIECIKQLEQEVRFLSQFKHANIVQYYGSDIIDDRFYIYLEYVHPGSINRYVRQHVGTMTESVVRNFTRHILHGLAYLHSKKIMHRDIKGANLLVDVHGVVKLADFGTAKHLNGVAGALSLKGSPYWMAPEVVQATMNKDIGYDLAVDIWSLGCTIIEMLTGKHPWSGLEGAAALFKVLHNDPPIPESLSNDGKDFLRSCFLRNPAERPSAEVLLEHPFIRYSHHSICGSLQAFADIKIIENSITPSDQVRTRSETCMKGKRSGERTRCRFETSEMSVTRAAPRSPPETINLMPTARVQRSPRRAL